MTLSHEEKDLLVMMASKYKRHLVSTYERDLPMPKGVSDDLLADILIQLDEFTEGLRPLEKLQLGILGAMYDTLAMFNITNQESPMVTARDKVAVAMSMAKKLN